MSADRSPGAAAYVETPAPPPDVPWRQAEFCVVDLETTGLDASRDEIISFAALQIAGGRMRADVVYRLVRPHRMPDAETIRIHGLRPADLDDAPALEDVLDELLGALAGRVLVAHVAEVERAFLSAALREHGLKLSNPLADTAALGVRLMRRRHQAPAGRLGLSELARALDLPVHRPHHADGDALTTAQVFLATAAHLDADHPQTVGSLAAYPARANPLSALLSRLRRR